MTLGGRILRLLRAELGAVLDTGRGRPTAERAAAGSSAAAPAPAVRDPTLAGYYANLEVAYGSDLATVEAAWKRLQRSYHPDLCSGDPERERTATELVQGLNHAYAELRRRLAPRPTR